MLFVASIQIRRCSCGNFTIVILFQEGKSAGLGTIAGVADTYWGKNKGRSKEGRLVKATVTCVVLFFILSMVLNMGIW